MPTDYAITVENLRKSYKDLKVLNSVTFKVERGRVLAILGPSGAGKTTTVRILSTLLSADTGSVTVDGFDLATQAKQVRSRIGLTGQFAAVDEYLSAEENLLMMGRLYHLSMADTTRRTKELLKQFDLAGNDRPVKTFSGGMKRRVDLAMSLIASPPILFLDEPTTGLDPPSRLLLWDIIKSLAAQGTTILLTTQHMEEADVLANKIIVIDHGKVIAQGTPDELKAKVGAERLEITLQNPQHLVAAQKILKGERFEADGKRNTVSVTAKGGVQKLKEVLDRFEQAQIPIDSISLHKPTLDDVFLTLTGHATSSEDMKKPRRKV